MQVETQAGMASLDAIARTDGVDGVFFGPADLSASMGLLGQPGHPRVHRALLDGIATVRAAGKAPGILSSDPVRTRDYLDAGALFVAVGVDLLLLRRACTELLAQYRSAPPQPPAAAALRP